MLISLLFVIMISGCESEKVMQPDSPVHASILLKHRIDIQDYDTFQLMFAEGMKEKVSEKTFEQFGEMMTSGTNYKNFELLTFGNGEMLLVEFAPKTEDDDKLKIVNVKVVPDGMKSWFNK